MSVENPFHKGELRVQERAGEVAQGARNGRVITDAIVPGALTFIDQQPMVVLGSIDDRENVWASVLFGHPGFMTAPNDRTVEFDLSRAGINPHDPFWTNIDQNPQVGALVIDLATRRRLRVNGRMARPRPERLVLNVAETYPNCPKYIQRRQIKFEATHGAAAPVAPVDGVALRGHHEALISNAATFFVASAHPDRGLDASHRGGPPGFVGVLDGRTLRIPDYVGNSLFNTLGNFAANPRAGLVFLDFDRGRTLQLIGRPAILWDQADPTNATGGTKRFWDLTIDRWRASALPAVLRWEFLDYSPHNPQPVAVRP